MYFILSVKVLLQQPPQEISSIIMNASYTVLGRDSSVGIATRYGLDGPEFESQWGARFSAPVRTGPGAHPFSCTMGTGSLQGLKAAGA
jgi:hypothetical protein